MFFNRNAGDPTKWLVDFDTSRPAFADSLTRNAIGRLTWQVSPRNKISLSHSEQYDRQNKRGGGSATRTPEAQGMTLYTPGHIQTATWTSPFTNRLLFEAGWGNYLSRYANFAPRVDGSHNDTMISVVEQCSRQQLCPSNSAASRPDLSLQPAAPAGIRAPSDRHAGADAGVGLVHPRLAQPEVRVSGQHQPPEPGVFQLHAVHSVPVQQRRPQSAESDGGLPRHGEVPAQHPDDVVLRAGHLHARAADASGRRALRRHRHQLPGHRRRRSRLSADADAHLLRRRARPTRSTGRTSRRASAPPTTCSATARRRSRSTSAST